jgi:hypothetical protein
MTPTTVTPVLAQVPVGSVAPVLWFFFGIILLMTAYYVFAELYHWLRWGYMYPLVWIALPVYFIGVLVLIGAMLAGISVA